MISAMFYGSRFLRVARCAADGVLAAALLTAVAAPAGAQEPIDPERLLVNAMIESRQGDIDEALRLLHPLLDRVPRFRAAELLYHDLARTTRYDRGVPDANAQLEADRRALLAEADARLEGYLDPHTSGWYVPAGLISASDKQRYAVVVDLSLSRLYLFENTSEGFELRAHHYVSAGKNGSRKERQGDRRTPVGTYFVTGRVTAKQLPDFYGAGALPVNYPNEWDLRRQRTGYGIWLHGVPRDTYSRTPNASDGCLVLSNDVFEDLWSRLEPVVTPVLIYEQVEWLPQAEAAAHGAELLEAVNAWRDDWESLDEKRYARHYAGTFRSGRQSREHWLQHKAQINASKRYVDVELRELNAFGYPGEPDLAVVTFEQVYRSSNYDWRGRKRQYWRNIDGRWQIVFEGDARILPVHERGIPAAARVTAALF